MAVALSERYLAVRADDHVMFGVQWWDAEPVAGGGPPRVRTGPEGGGLLITFPPQHLGEGAFPVGLPLELSSGALGGLSQIAVALESNTVVVLDLAGILSAIRSGQVLGRRFPNGTDATVIEMPYALRWAPVSASGGATTCVHPVAPVPGPSSKAIGLWRTRLRGFGVDGHSSADGLGDDLLITALALLPRQPEPTHMPLADDRQAIIDAALSHPPAVSRLELSALGGSLSARLSTDTFDWSQDVTLGRDQRVRLVEHGLLYPFGHRALYIEATERQLDADGTAALREHRSLIVTEPSRSMVVDDAALNRRFPFDDVEITTLVFPDLGPPRSHDLVRPAPDIADVFLSRDEKQATRDALKAGIDPILTRDRTVEELTTPEAAEYLSFRADLNAANAELADAAELEAARSRILDEIERVAGLLSQAEGSGPQSPDGSVSGSEETIAALNEQLAQLRLDLQDHPPAAQGAIAAAQAAAAIAQQGIDRLQPTIDAQCQADLTVGELAAGDPNDPAVQDANRILVLDQEIRALQDIIEATPTTPIFRPWILGPTVLPAPPLPPTASAESLAPLLVPLRCSTRTSAQPDVHLDVPLVFVRDFDLDADGSFPAFHSLTDGDGTDTLQDILDRFAASHAATGVSLPVLEGTGAGGTGLQGIGVGLAGTAIDVVHGAVQAAGDRLEVHGLQLVGLAHGGGFVPAIDEYQAKLPALRGLFGAAQDVIRPLGYRTDFLTHGDAEDVALEFLGNTSLGIDFRAQADRSGGLLAPVIDATGISRLHGPVSIDGALDAATGHLDPFKVLGEGATLLGFDLRTLIGELPEPPKIVQELIAGRPSVRVKWGGTSPPDKPIVLKSEGPFDAAPRPGVKATFTLTADVAPEGITTTCIVRDFALCFPSPGDPLLKLTFESVEFRQTAGQEPDLSLHGVGVEFLGDLQLLEELQKKVPLGSNVPKVKVSSSGIGVGYAFEVPNADCGEFTLRNIAVRAGLDVPFQPTDEQPIVLSLGFASRARPFNLSVMALGGGGYIAVELSRSGLRRMELSLEFGATLALNFGIVSAEVHALAGARAEIGPGTHVSITGFVRIGGAVELLGLVTVTIELVVALRYDPDTKALFGRATVVVEIDLTLYSDSIELDSGEWRLVGGGGPSFGAVSFTGTPPGRVPPDRVPPDRVPPGRSRPDIDAGLEAWRRYRRAFAREVVQ